MSFRPETVSITAPCRRHCTGQPVNVEVIEATGEITNSTADDFLAFLKQNVGDGQLRPIVVMRSPGGNVVGAMQLGLMFRKLGASVIVGRMVDDPAGDHSYMARGDCMSACVYAFFGGVKRVVPETSRLGIHRMAIYGSEHDPAGGSVSTRTFGTSDLVTALSDYTKTMGVSPAVINYAEQIAPDTIHIVTPREMVQWHMGSPRL